MAEQAKIEIAKTISKVIQNQEIAKFVIARGKRKKVIEAWKKVYSDKKNEVVNFFVNGSVVDVTGSSSGVEFVRSWMVANGFLFVGNNQQIAETAQENLCQICYCELEQPYFYKVCGHGGCNSCLASQFSQAEVVTVPITCFSSDCSHCLLALSDVYSLTSATVSAAIEESALAKFLRENRDLVDRCPNHSCNQLVNLRNIQQISGEDDEVRLGGRVFYCDECDKKVIFLLT